MSRCVATIASLMQKSFLATAILSMVAFFAGFLFMNGKSDSDIAIPQDPNTGVAVSLLITATSTSIASTSKNASASVPHATKAAIARETVRFPPDYPSTLIIPKIHLNDPIIQVGLTDAGLMAVPSGATSNIGWYKYGTVPGRAGNSVIDAHVFAAFSKLNRLAVGDSIIVDTVSGEKLTFVVIATTIYALADVPEDALFGATDEAHLNLITCAGNLTADHSTYDHRIIVYTKLVHR